MLQTLQTWKNIELPYADKFENEMRWMYSFNSDSLSVVCRLQGPLTESLRYKIIFITIITHHLPFFAVLPFTVMCRTTAALARIK